MPTKISEILGQKNVLRLELEGQSTAINYVIRYHTNITTTAHINFIQSYNLFPWDFVFIPTKTPT